jgi:hypothetical protein
VHAPADGYALLLAHTAKAIKATLKRNGRWLVAHLVRDEGVAGSNPATPTST